MILQRLRAVIQTRAFAIVLSGSLLLCGCAAPNLRPFADASIVLAASVKTGGDLAIAPLSRQALWDGANFVQPDDPNHPAKSLQATWELRRRSMDAVMVYSASLAAINDSANHRQENAAELLDSVKQLASAVPGISVGSGPARDLIVSGLGILVEIRAWHDMGKAVKAADPAIQLMAQVLKKDLAALSDEFESKQRNQVIQKTISLRPIERFHQKLQDSRTAQRAKVEGSPHDASLGHELARIDGLMTGVAPELAALRSERRQLAVALANGKAFYASALKAIEAWAEAHSELAKAFEQRRLPNLVLLLARAQELNALIENLKD